MSNQELSCVCGNTAIKTEHYTNGVLRVECECGVSGPWVDFFSMNDEIAKNEACRLWTEMQNKLYEMGKVRAVLDNSPLVEKIKSGSGKFSSSDIAVAFASLCDVINVVEGGQT